MTVETKVKPIMVRLPDELARWLKHRAVDARRSANSELIVILEKVRAEETQQVPQ